MPSNGDQRSWSWYSRSFASSTLRPLVSTIAKSASAPIRMAPLRGARPKSRAGVVDMSSAIRPSETSRSCSACVANTGNISSAPLPDPGGIVHTVAPSALGSGAWSLPTVWMRPSRTCSHSRSTEAALRVGGFHFCRRSPSHASRVVHR